VSGLHINLCACACGAQCINKKDRKVDIYKDLPVVRKREGNVNKRKERQKQRSEVKKADYALT